VSLLSRTKLQLLSRTGLRLPSRTELRLPSRTELRVGLCPGRLVLPDAVLPVAGDPVAALGELKSRRLAVVLSSHFARYAVLRWSAALKSERDWLAFAQHTFASTYGAAAAGWRIRVSAGRAREARVASAVDGALLDALRALPQVVSVQPYLMAAFNARRRALGRSRAWFVLQEPGRLTLALIGEERWQLVRTRQTRETWRDELADILEREAASAAAGECDAAWVCAEEEVPAKIGRYRVTDVTLPNGANPAFRPQAMVLH
jgi:hypothetical protein